MKGFNSVIVCVAVQNNSARSVQALPTDWLIYDEMSRGHRMASVRCCSMVTPITVAIFGGCAKLPSSALQEPIAQKGTANLVKKKPACVNQVT